MMERTGEEEYERTQEELQQSTAASTTESERMTFEEGLDEYQLGAMRFR